LKTPLKLGLSRYRLGPSVQDTKIKTTARDFYDGERTRLKALQNIDEVIFLNENDELCEGSFTSLFLKIDGTILTPAWSSGLLLGVLRQELLETGQAREAVLSLEDLQKADEIYVGNSLRGLMSAQFKDFLLH